MFDKTKTCPLLNKQCLEHKCQWFIQLQGIQPQTGVQTNEWGCSVAWLPILLVENSQQQRQTGAAIEQVRNKIVPAFDALTNLAKTRKQLPEGSNGGGKRITSDS